MKWLSKLLFPLLGGIIFLLFAYFQSSTTLADPDGFYHMKMAQLLVQQGIVKEFWWLPYTTLGQHYVDQHFLFHVLLIPFVTIGNPFIGVKLFTALLGTAMMITLAWLMRTLKLRWWFLVTLILALTITFTFRINLIKATPLSLIFLCGIIWGLARKHYRSLILLNALYVWTYGGFALAGMIGVIWCISQILTGNLKSKTGWLEQLKALLAIGGGMVIGIIVNPYFPTNLAFYGDQLIQIGVINYQSVIGVGAEWYPYESSQLMLSSILLVLAALAGLIAIIWQRKKLSQLDWFGLGSVFVSTALTLKSRRYVEYFGPLLALAAAIWLNHIIINWSKLQHWFQHTKLKALLGYHLLLAVFIIQTVPIVLHDTQQNTNDLHGGIPITKFRSASLWLRDHGKAHTKILHSDWDDFPQLFYYNSNHAYMAGLDPTFMYRYNQELYWLWVKITTGEYKGDIDAALTTLDVQYVLIEKDHKTMKQLIERSSRVTLIYQDQEADIFEVAQK